MQFLHGTIRAHIIAAEGLPDWDTAFFNIDGKDTTDAYVCGELGHARLFKTKYVPNELNPTWDEVFNVYVCHHANTLRIHVKDKEHIGASWIASCDIRLEEELADANADAVHAFVHSLWLYPGLKAFNNKFSVSVPVSVTCVISLAFPLIVHIFVISKNSKEVND